MSGCCVTIPPLLLLVLLLSGATRPVTTSPSVSIYRVSGCTDVGNTTTLCGPSAQVTLWGTGFTNDTSAPMNLSVGSWSTLIYGWAVRMATQSFSVWLPTSLPLGVMLNVSITVPLLNASSNSFPGVSLWDYPPPTLLSVSGCDGSGSLTANCAPDTAILTFVGQNLTALGFPSTVTLAPLTGTGSSSVNFWYNKPSYTNNTVNDTTIVLALADVYESIVRGTQQYGGMVRIYFQWQSRVASNSLNISLVPLPPPQVLTLRGTKGCNNSLTSSSTLYTFDCVGGYSEVLFTGHYYYDPLTITVGGQECYMEGMGSTWFSARYAACLLPMLPTGSYDVNLTTSGGTILLLQAVGISSAPQVSSITSSQCGVDGQSERTRPSMKCAGGEVVTVGGQQFRSDVTDFNITITGWWNRSQVLYCLSPSFVNATQLTCILPIPPPFYFSLNDSGFGSGYVTMQVVYDGVQDSNSFLILLYNPLRSPVFLSLSAPGCSGPGIDAATGAWPTYTGCEGADGVLMAITGQQFSASGGMQVQTGRNSDVYCSTYADGSFYPGNETSLICALQGFSFVADAYDTPKAFSVLNNNLWLTSTVFYVRFLPPQNSTTEESSTSGTQPWVVAVSVICTCVLVVVALGAGWWQWKRREKRQSLMGSDNTGSSFDSSLTYQSQVNDGEVSLVPMRV